MNRRKLKPSLKQTIEQNRAQMTGMAKLFGNPAPVFSEMSTDKPKRKYTKNPNAVLTISEHDIQKTIIAYLKAHPGVGLAIRINSGVMEQDGRYVAFNSQKGMSDIFGVMKTGRAFFLEVKSSTGKVTQSQHEFLAIALGTGAYAGIARSIEDVDKILGFA
jgi:hypothetical protein